MAVDALLGLRPDMMKRHCGHFSRTCRVVAAAQSFRKRRRAIRRRGGRLHRDDTRQVRLVGLLLRVAAPARLYPGCGPLLGAQNLPHRAPTPVALQDKRCTRLQCPSMVSSWACAGRPSLCCPSAACC